MLVQQGRSASRPEAQTTLSRCEPVTEKCELKALFNWNRTALKSAGKRSSNAKKAPKSKKKKLQTWTHTFVCLANTYDNTVPDSHMRSTLKLAGLGEKRFPIEIHSTGQEVYDELLFQFPELEGAGGIEMLRVPEEGGKDLEAIPAPDDFYSVEYLRAVIKNARIFVRPLQHNLDIEPKSTDVSL